MSLLSSQVGCDRRHFVVSQLPGDAAHHVRTVVCARALLEVGQLLQDICGSLPGQARIARRADAIRLMARGQVRPADLITHRLPIGDALAGFDALRARQAVKVMFEMTTRAA